MSVRVRLPNPLSALDDRSLLTRFADERDQPAFEQLVKRHGGLVYGVCKRTVRDTHLAEDAFQAVFLVLARNPQRAAEATSVGGWLFGVARRVGLGARRHKERREKHSWRAGVGSRGSPLMEQQHSTNPSSDFDDLLRVLDEELAALPDDLRSALVACFLQERTQDEAARELGWSLSTLRRRLERGKELLRSRLARRGVTLAVGLFVGGIASPARAAVPALVSTPSATVVALAGEAFRRGISAKLFASVAGAALALGGIAFGFAHDSDSTGELNTPKAVAASAPAPPAEIRKWTTISGRVVFPKGRELPKTRFVSPEQIKDADVWEPFMPLKHEDTLIQPETRGVANVVVFLRPDSDDRKAEFPVDKIHPALANVKPANHTITARAGQFTPRVLAARVGDSVTFNNMLPVPTNVNYVSASHAGDVDFNVLLVKGMSHTTKPLAASRLADHYSSIIYPWMRGCVWTFEHPYFAVTDANGRFEIPHAPVGKWRLVLWHEAAGYIGAEGRLGEPVTIQDELPSVVLEGKNWPE